MPPKVSDPPYPLISYVLAGSEVCNYLSVGTSINGLGKVQLLTGVPYSYPQCRLIYGKGLQLLETFG